MDRFAHLRSTESHGHLYSKTDLFTLTGHLMCSDRNALERELRFCPPRQMLWVLSGSNRKQLRPKPSPVTSPCFPSTTLRLACQEVILFLTHCMTQPLPSSYSYAHTQ